MKSLQKIIREAENWPYYDFKDGFLYDENNPKTPAFNKKFNSSIEAEKWLEDNNERGTVRYREAGPNLYRTRIQKREVKSLKQLAEDASNYSDADSGSGIIMDPNKSEMNEFEKASTEYTFTATDDSKIEIEVNPKDYHILAQGSSPGLANKAWNELKIGRLSGDISSFRKLTDTLLKLGFKVNKKSSTHKEFDPLPDEDKWRNH